MTEDRFRFIGSEKRIRALEVSESILKEYCVVAGVTGYTEQNIEDLARFLFPDAFKTLTTQDARILASLG